MSEHWASQLVGDWLGCEKSWCWLTLAHPHVSYSNVSPMMFIVCRLGFQWQWFQFYHQCHYTRETLIIYKPKAIPSHYSQQLHLRIIVTRREALAASKRGVSLAGCWVLQIQGNYHNSKIWFFKHCVYIHSQLIPLINQWSIENLTDLNVKNQSSIGKLTGCIFQAGFPTTEELAHLRFPLPQRTPIPSTLVFGLTIFDKGFNSVLHI